MSTVISPNPAKPEIEQSFFFEKILNLRTNSLIMLGTLTGIVDEEIALVNFLDFVSDAPVQARSLITLHSSDIGLQVAIQFDKGDIQHPVVLGLIGNHKQRLDHSNNQATRKNDLFEQEDIVIEAKRSIRLQCGAASITLTSDGTIELRGLDIESRAAGQNRIKGSSVSLN
jgi:Domain of unknown function (DUF6484)